ncbi:MAG: hypothetical protein CME88_08595 [Hirschia sp.]|nr:hypothetical protein [Hirschia sp.]MBB34656.1 hypothetical protein [Hirschia sp.]MBF18420.1 hypothetical protein [Hirschia sp.]
MKKTWKYIGLATIATMSLLAAACTEKASEDVVTETTPAVQETSAVDTTQPVGPKPPCMENVTFVDSTQWHGCEKGGRWMRVTTADVEVKLPEEPVSGILIYGGIYGPARNVTVYVNGTETVSEATFGPDKNILVPLPEGFQQETATLRIELDGGEPVSPKSLGVSTDSRPLAMMLRRIDFKKAS